MKKEDIIVVAQLLSAIREALIEIDFAKRKKDEEKIAMIKQEILKFQKKIDELI